MKKVASRLFKFPEKSDISIIELGDIMKVLSKPHIDELKDSYLFKDDLDMYKQLY